MKPADVVLTAVFFFLVGTALGSAVTYRLDEASVRSSFDAAWRCCGGK